MEGDIDIAVTGNWQYTTNALPLIMVRIRWQNIAQCDYALLLL